MAALTDADRGARLAENLGALRRRVDAAARAAGRDPGELTLIAVSKTWPASDVAALARLGVADFGENREQEASPKVAEVARLLTGAPAPAGAEPPTPVPTWHFVGRLQRNKARSIASWAHWVHSLDRDVLVAALDAAAERAGRVVTICVQVSLDPPGAGAGRGGAPLDDVGRLADLAAAAPNLRLAGLMAVAPLGEPPEPAFARLAKAHERLISDHPAATAVSAGMSRDLEEAVTQGATHLRVGTALFGARPTFP